MSEGVFLRQGDTLVEMVEQPYELEDHLQELLASHPDLLAGGQMDREAPRRWLLISREAGLPSEEDRGSRWSVDHLFLDQDAVPTLVEVKRSSDTRLRREVVGQLLDYAANAVSYWDIDQVRNLFETQCRARQCEPGDVLREFLGDEAEPEDFWERTRANLQAARLRLVFVADNVPPELQRIVEYLNEQMSGTEVLAVEVKQFVGGGLQSLVPRVLGQTQAARRAKGVRARPSARAWDKASALEDLEAKAGKESALAAAKILEWAEAHGLRIVYGRGSQDGSFQPGLDDETGYLFPFGFYTDGSVAVHFQWMLPFQPFDQLEKRKELQARLNVLPGVNLPDDRLEKRPTFQIAVLTDGDAMAKCLETAEWAFDEARKARRAGLARPV